MQALSDHVTHYQAQIKTPLGRAIEGLRRATSAQASDAEAKLALRKFDIELAKLAEKQQALEKDLTQKLGLADKPKLHGMLLLMGVLERGMVCSAMTFN